MQICKNAAEIQQIRRAGRLVAGAHRLMARMLRPGRCTADLNAAAEDYYRRQGAEAVLKEVRDRRRGRPFPAAVSVSVNEEAAGGTPGPRRLNEGDLVTLDTACRLDGWCTDAAWTYPIGRVSAADRRLLQAGEQVLSVMIEQLGRCRTWAHVVEKTLEEVRGFGFTLIEELAGHGIGRELHEDPQLSNRRRSNGSGGRLEREILLTPGLVLAVEPVLTAGIGRLTAAPDGFGLLTHDRSPAVHFEHTVALGQNGPIVLTAGVGKAEAMIA